MDERPTIRGAFAAFAAPPEWITFQYNPELIFRHRKIQYSVPGRSPTGLREFHANREYGGVRGPQRLQHDQDSKIEEETVSFRLKFVTETDNDIDCTLGVAPQLAALEQLVQPLGPITPRSKGFKSRNKSSGVGGRSAKLEAAAAWLKGANPPVVLFYWGPGRIALVNMKEMKVIERKFAPLLWPIEASVDVKFSIIEGSNYVYTLGQAEQRVMAGMYLKNTHRTIPASFVPPL